MSSTQRDSSIASSSIFIPNWVKNKLENSGFDPSALSPPNHDSEFFYVKFPKSEKHPESSIQSTNPIGERLAAGGRPSIVVNRRQFAPIISGPIVKSSDSEMGVEEGIGSIVQQIVSGGGGKSPIRGFTTDDASEQKPSGKYLRQRRNSKSLPASPITSPETSPRTRRKNATAFALQNRFPAGAIAATSLVEGEENNAGNKLKPSWILSGLFSQSKENGLNLRNRENRVAAEERTEEESPNRTNVNVTVEVKPSSIAAAPIIDKKVYLKKRNEIRELNFMSPVSM